MRLECLYIVLPSVIGTQTVIFLIRFRELSFISISYLSHGGTLLVAQLVEALRYKSEGRVFDFR